MRPKRSDIEVKNMQEIFAFRVLLKTMNIVMKISIAKQQRLIIYSQTSGI